MADILAAVPLVDLAGWTASVATMIGACMTAANLNSRVTGWGFVAFAAGSAGWIATASLTGQSALLFTNMFLAVVNAVGVWRWLGRQARYEEGGRRAARRSRRRPVPTLFSAEALIGAPLHAPDGTRLGTVVDAMMACGTARVAYLVVADHGLAGIGETLRALGPEQLAFDEQGVIARIARDAYEALPPITGDDWPVALPANGAA